MPDDKDLNPAISTNDLDWLAFCYVADELNTDQHYEFESRLATDQSARDAVVHAMEQSQLLHSALSLSEPRLAGNRLAHSEFESVSDKAASIRKRRFSPSMLAVAAALLLVAASFSWFVQSGLIPDNSSPLAKSDISTAMNLTAKTTLSDADQLASVWADALKNSIGHEDPLLFVEPDGSYTNVVFEDQSWMLDALIELRSDADSPSTHLNDRELESTPRREEFQ